MVEGTLISSSYDREYGKGKKATTPKLTLWQIRADSVRKLNRGDRDPAALRSRPDDSHESQSTSAQDVPF